MFFFSFSHFFEEFSLHGVSQTELGLVTQNAPCVSAPQYSRGRSKHTESWEWLVAEFSGVAWQKFSFSIKSISVLASLCVLVFFASALGLSEQSADPADQGLDKSVAGANLAVQTLHLQQLPLQSLSETCGHVALQLHSHRQKTEGSGKVRVVTHMQDVN